MILCTKDEDLLCGMTYFKNKHGIVSMGMHVFFRHELFTCYYWLCYWLALPKEFSLFSQSYPVAARTVPTAYAYSR